MSVLKRTKQDELLLIERKLRYAVIAVLNAWRGDIGVVEDIVSEAFYDWGIVNEVSEEKSKSNE